jgi:hypothetical protein
MPILKTLQALYILIDIKMIHSKHLLKMFSASHQKPTLIMMFPPTIVTKFPILLLRALVEYMSILIAPEANSFLGTFVHMMLTAQTIIAFELVETGVVVVAELFAAEAFYVLAEVSNVRGGLPEHGFLGVGLLLDGVGLGGQVGLLVEHLQFLEQVVVLGFA